MRIAVIVNQGAGSVVTGQVSAGSLRQSFQQEGTEAEVHVIPGEQILETAREALVYLDGEVTSMTPPLRYRTRPHALKVILPPRDASSGP